MGGALYLQAAQDIRVGGRLTKTEFQYTLQDADVAELYQWSPKILEKLQSLPMLRDVTTDQQMSGMTATLTIDRDQAARFGVQPQVIDDTLYDAFGQRRSRQYFAGEPHHLIHQVIRDNSPRWRAEQTMKSDAGGLCRCTSSCHECARCSAVDQPPEPFPALTIVLTCFSALWVRRSGASATARCQMACPSPCKGTFKRGQAFQSSAVRAEPDAAAQLPITSLSGIPRELHPTTGHPLLFAIRRRRALLMLLVLPPTRR
jgi:hypothetical protein